MFRNSYRDGHQARDGARPAVCSGPADARHVFSICSPQASDACQAGRPVLLLALASLPPDLPPQPAATDAPEVPVSQQPARQARHVAVTAQALLRREQAARHAAASVQALLRRERSVPHAAVTVQASRRPEWLVRRAVASVQASPRPDWSSRHAAALAQASLPQHQAPAAAPVRAPASQQRLVTHFPDDVADGLAIRRPAAG